MQAFSRVGSAFLSEQTPSITAHSEKNMFCLRSFFVLSGLVVFIAYANVPPVVSG